MVPDSLVGKDGAIGAGDWLLEVNGEPLAGKPQPEVVRMLREASGKTTLRAACRVYRDDFVLSGKAPQVLTEYVVEEVEIRPNADGFGLDIATTPEEGTTVTAIVPCVPLRCLFCVRHSNRRVRQWRPGRRKRRLPCRGHGCEP